VEGKNEGKNWQSWGQHNKTAYEDTQGANAGKKKFPEKKGSLGFGGEVGTRAVVMREGTGGTPDGTLSTIGKTSLEGETRSIAQEITKWPPQNLNDKPKVSGESVEESDKNAFGTDQRVEKRGKMDATNRKEISEKRIKETAGPKDFIPTKRQKPIQ